MLKVFIGFRSCLQLMDRTSHEGKNSRYLHCKLCHCKDMIVYTVLLCFNILVTDTRKNFTFIYAQNCLDFFYMYSYDVSLTQFHVDMSVCTRRKKINLEVYILGSDAFFLQSASLATKF